MGKRSSGVVTSGVRTSSVAKGVALAAALIVAACGSDDGGSSGTAATTGGTQAAAGTTAPAGTSAPSGGGAEACTGQPNDAVLKIGFAADFSDVGGASDRPASEAMKYTVDTLNEAGGAGGSKVELTVKNIDGDSARTQQAAQELLDSGVQAILGPPFVNFGQPLLTITQGQVPVISVASTDPQLANTDVNSFLTAFSDPRQDGAAAEVAYTDLGKKTAVTFSSPDDPYFTNNPKWFKEAFEEMGGKVTKDFTYSLGDSDFSSQVNEIASMNPKPEVLYTAMIMPLIGTLLGQLKGAGVTDMVVIGSDAFDATNVAAAGADADGVYYTTHTFPTPGSKLEQFLADYEAATGKPIETVTFGALADDAINLIVEACKTAKSNDPAALAEALKGIEGFEGLTGSITYAGTKGAPIKPVTIVKVEGGQPTFVKQLDPKVVPQP
jgi:branched-chain amino acid transport system substrate-binding protein